jgi:hypothetical protein
LGNPQKIPNLKASTLFLPLSIQLPAAIIDDGKRHVNKNAAAAGSIEMLAFNQNPQKPIKERALFEKNKKGEINL